MSTLDNMHTVLLQELQVSCDMVKLAIENMDETIWSKKTNDWSYVHTLYHIIDTIEFYSYDEPKKLVENGSLGIIAPNATDEQVQQIISEKSKKFFFDYLEKVKIFASDTITSLSTAELFEKDKFAEWGFTSRFHKFSYTLRHTMMHTGELNKQLRNLGKTRIKWL